MHISILVSASRSRVCCTLQNSCKLSRLLQRYLILCTSNCSRNDLCRAMLGSGAVSACRIYSRLKAGFHGSRVPGYQVVMTKILPCLVGQHFAWFRCFEKFLLQTGTGAVGILGNSDVLEWLFGVTRYDEMRFDF